MFMHKFRKGNKATNAPRRVPMLATMKNETNGFK
jgi:hypothetical protein